MTKLRAVATITLYVYGENEKQLINEAKLKVNQLNNIDDCYADLEKLHLNQFGSMDLKDIYFQ